MRYYTTLVGKQKYAFNGNRFVINERKEITEGVYNAVKDSPLFVSEIEGDTAPPAISTFSNERMNVALAYSPNWSTHVKKQVFAIFANNPPPVKVYLLSDELGKIDLEDICSFFGNGYSYEYINMEPLFKKYITSTCNISSRFTKYTLYRLFIPKVITVDRLLYLDSDTLVLDNIRDFYHMDFEDNLLIGVADVGQAMPVVRKAIGFDPNETYINAGVTLMNLKEINLYDTWIGMVNEKFYNCHDQDILNITCRGRIKLISNMYNSSLSTGFAGAYTKIAHYAGAKPWIKKLPAHVQLRYLFNKWNDNEISFLKLGFTVIPKYIHYCWFGGAEKSDLVKKCIASWKRHMPNYTLVEWNESNFDLTAHGSYVKQAAEYNKWAFVTDYIRLWALNKYGGVYMDSDVMVLRPLDIMLKNRAFTGHETDQLMVTATMGAEPEHPWIQYLLAYYNSAKFEDKPNTNVITKMSEPHVIKSEKGFRVLKDGVLIYPVETLCPYDHKNFKPIPTHNSYAVHLFAGSWLGRKDVDDGNL